MRPLQILCAPVLLAAMVHTARGETHRPRVALVSQSSQAAAGQALDLALAELTKQSGVELVEREAIDAILREQKIALTDADAGLRVGQLLRADLIGVVDASPDGKELGGIVVLDSASGAVFANEGLAGLKAAEAAALVTKAVSAAATKRALPADQRNTVCLLGARNSEFARSKDVFCETVAYLVERRLLHAAGVTTLDRRRLDAVLKENSLPGQAEKKSLLPSLRLVELDFRRGAQDGAMKVVVRLSDAKGNTVATDEVQGPEEAAKLVELAGARVCELLRTAPPALPGDPAAEANRFRKQAAFLGSVGLYEQSLLSLQSAIALDSESRDHRTGYVGAIVNVAFKRALEKKDYEGATAMIGRYFDEADRFALPVGFNRALSDALGRCMDALPMDSPAGARVEVLRQRYLACLNQVAALPPDPRMTGQYFSFQQMRMLQLCRSNEEFFRQLAHRLDDWLQLENDPAKAYLPLCETLRELSVGARRFIRKSEADLPFDAGFARGLHAVCARLIAHPRAIVQLEGRIGALYSDLEWARTQESQMPAAELKARLREILAQALKAAADTGTPAADVPHIYTLALNACVMTSREGMPVRANEQCTVDLVTGMLKNRHLSGEVLEDALRWKTGDLHGSRTEEHLREFAYPLLSAVEVALGDPTFRRMDIRQDRIASRLKDLHSFDPLPAPLAPAATLVWTNRLAAGGRDFMGVVARREERHLIALRARMPDMFPNGGASFDLHRVDLASGRSEKMASARLAARLNFVLGDRPASTPRDAFITGALIEENGDLLLASGGDGLLTISRDGRAETRIGTAQGLPDGLIQSAVSFRGYLFAGIGDQVSQFVRYDSSTGKCLVIASTGRTSPETPWDTMQGFTIFRLFADPARERLLALLHTGDLSPGTGLWEYRPRDARFRQLLALDRQVRQAGVLPDGRVWMIPFISNLYRPTREPADWSGLVVFDPASDTARLVCENRRKRAGPALDADAETRILAPVIAGWALPAGDWLYYLNPHRQPGRKPIEVRRVSLTTCRDELLDECGQGDMGRWGYLDWLPDAGVLLVGTGYELRALKPNMDRSAHGLLDATREQFVGRWSYQAQGKQWEREFLADGTARLRVDGKDTPSFSGFTWTVENGALLLRRGDGTLDERSYLADADTMTFTISGWGPARRVEAPRGLP